MKMKIIAAVAVFAAVPAFAQQGGAPKPSEADVKKLVQSIQSDKAKQAQYCDMMKIYEDAAAADEKKDQKKVEELTKKADDASKKLGAEYEKVMNGLQSVDPSTPDGQKLSALLDPLDAACGAPAGKK